MGDLYTLTFVNNSSNDWTFCCYQTDPKIGPKDVRSLAWFTKRVTSGSEVDFEWEIDYSFVWAETGVLKPGVIFKASAKVPAGTRENNSINFTRIGNEAFKFVKQSTDPNYEGSLVIHQDDKIPLDKASVGIGMSGAGTFVVPAQPSIDVSFSPHPNYWVTFGEYRSGQVLDIQQVTKKAQVPFANNVYAMYAILGQDNKWTIVDTRDVNARLSDSDDQNAMLQSGSQRALAAADDRHTVPASDALYRNVLRSFS
ncbi:MAG: protein rhiA [Thermoanaerobaculia bacterium]